VIDAVKAQAPTAQLGIVEMRATLGGGSLPGETLASIGIAIEAVQPAACLARLRARAPVVVARIAGGAVHLDLRTVDPGEDAALTTALVRALDEAARQEPRPGP
jgi:L-seryl-tRNA(Ser) seleniumtransferase